MGRHREKPMDPFLQFLMDEAGLEKISEAVLLTGISHQVLTKYADEGLDSLPKRIKLARLFGVNMLHVQAWISNEISEIWHETGLNIQVS